MPPETHATHLHALPTAPFWQPCGLFLPARHRVLAIIQALLLFVPSGAVLARRFKGNHMAAVALPLGREFDFDASAALSRSDWFGGSLSAVRSNQELVGRHELACCGYPGWKLVVRV